MAFQSCELRSEANRSTPTQLSVLLIGISFFIPSAPSPPNARVRWGFDLFIVTLDASILASLLLAASALSDVAKRDWGSLIRLTANVGSTYLFVRYQKGEIQLPALRIESSRKKKPDRNAALVDEILKKVHREGMQSLSSKEGKR